MLVNAYLLSPRQREIAEAALSILSNTGVQSLTMKMIAARLHITDAALYRHFQNKEELLEGIALLFEESSRKTLERIAAENLAPLERVKTFFLDRCRAFSDSKGLTMVLFSEELFKSEKCVSRRLASLMESHEEVLSHSLKEAQRDGAIDSAIPPSHLFIMIMGSLRLLVTQWRNSDGAFSLVDEGERLWDTLEERILKGERR